MRHNSLNKTTQFNNTSNKLRAVNINKIIWLLQTVVVPLVTLYLKNKKTKQNKGL